MGSSRRVVRRPVLSRTRRDELLQVGDPFLFRKEGYDVRNRQAVSLPEREEFFFRLFHRGLGWAVSLKSREFGLEAAKGVGRYGHGRILPCGWKGDHLIDDAGGRPIGLEHVKTRDPRYGAGCVANLVL